MPAQTQVLMKLHHLQKSSFKLNSSMEDISLKQILNEYYEPEDDKMNQARLDDTRRPRLTLRHLNKLRKVRELRQMEQAAHSDFVKDMYGASAEEGGGEEF